MKDISPILKSLGFLDSETKTYLAALSTGPSTVIDLTKQVKLSRQAVYVAIESLTERGIMSSTLIGKKRFYAAEKPEKLLAYAKRRESEMDEHVKDLEKAIPDLELRTGGERPSVKVLEGKEGLRAYLYELSTENPEMIYEITDRDAMAAAITAEDLAPVKKNLVKTNSKLNALYSGNLPQARPGSEVFSLPKEFSDFKSDITLYGNKVAFVTFAGKMQTVIVENKHIAEVVRVLFKIALREAKKDFKQI